MSAGTSVNEMVSQLAQRGAGKYLIEAWTANYILSAHPGEMGTYLARVYLTEH